MKKGIRIALTVVLVLILAMILLILILSHKPAAPADYQRTTGTGGAIEAEYMKNGAFQVVKHEDGTLQEFGKYIVFYPSELESTDRKWPVIVMCNGSGTPLSKYETVARHYAS